MIKDDGTAAGFWIKNLLIAPMSFAVVLSIQVAEHLSSIVLESLGKKRSLKKDKFFEIDCS